MLSVPLLVWFRPVEIDVLFHRNFNIQQRCVLLASENVPFSGTAAGGFAVDGEFDGIGRIELHKVTNAFLRNIVQPGHCLRVSRLLALTRS